MENSSLRLVMYRWLLHYDNIPPITKFLCRQDIWVIFFLTRSHFFLIIKMCVGQLLIYNRCSWSALRYPRSYFLHTISLCKYSLYKHFQKFSFNFCTCYHAASYDAGICVQSISGVLIINTFTQALLFLFLAVRRDYYLRAAYYL